MKIASVRSFVVYGRRRQAYGGVSRSARGARNHSEHGQSAPWHLTEAEEES